MVIRETFIEQGLGVCMTAVQLRSSSGMSVFGVRVCWYNECEKNDEMCLLLAR